MKKILEYKDKEWLIDKIQKYKNVTDISINTGHAATSLNRYIDKYNLKDMLEHKKKIKKIDISKYPYKDKKWLTINLMKYKNIKTLCECTGYAQTSIRRYAHHFELEYLIENRTYSRNLKLNENYFEVIDTERKAYWLGLIMADGCVRNADSRYCLSISLKNEDGYLIENFKNDLESEANVYVDSYKRHSIKVWSKKLFNDLHRHGVFPNKTGNETFPNINDNLKHHFVRGFFDGDGTIHRRNNRKRHKGTVGFCCQNERFVIDIIYEIENQCGFKLTYHKHKNNVFEFKTESLSKCNALIKYMYKDATIAMLRKYNRAKEYFNYDCPSLKQFEEEFKLIAGTD